MPRLVFLLLLLASVASSWATDARVSGSTLIVNEVEIATVQTGAGAFTPAKKAAAAANVLLTWKKGQEVKAAAPVNPEGDWVIQLNNRRVLTISQDEADSQRESAADLASIWVKALNKALNLPPLVADSGRVVLPPDGTMMLTLTGTHARKATLGQSTKGIVEIKRATGILKIKALAVGDSVLTILYGPYILKIPINILPYAAKLPQKLDAQVFGSPADSSLVRSAVLTAVMQNLKRPDYSAVQLGQFNVSGLNAGNEQTIRIPIKIEAAGHFPSRGDITINVRNTGNLKREEDVLFYSNEPENLSGPGRLYYGEIASNKTARLLVHHCNRTRVGLTSVYLLANQNKVPIRVAISMGDAEPDQNPTLAGYRAGDLFFRGWLAQAATVIEIPPESALPFIFRRMAPNDTSSCLATIQHLGGGDLPLRIIGEAVLPQSLPSVLKVDSYPARPWEGLRALPLDTLVFNINGTPSHVYPSPSRQETFDYQHGGPWAFVRIGQKAIPNDSGSGVLLGNFGVHYYIEGTISNPTDRPAKIDVLFEASAGYSGALFLVNGQYMAANILQSKATFMLKKVNLEPGGSERIRIQTIPLSGANYPATIIIRPENGGQ
jgi:hypothetical protein